LQLQGSSEFWQEVRKVLSKEYLKSEMKLNEGDFDSIFYRKIDRANLVAKLSIMWNSLLEGDESS
jgi:hypothetical protein